MRIRWDLHGVFIESRILLVILIQPLDLACFYIVYSAGDLLLSEQRILFRGKGGADLLAGAENIQMAGRTYRRSDKRNAIRQYANYAGRSSPAVRLRPYRPRR